MYCAVEGNSLMRKQHHLCPRERKSDSVNVDPINRVRPGEALPLALESAPRSGGSLAGGNQDAGRTFPVIACHAFYGTRTSCCLRGASRHCCANTVSLTHLTSPSVRALSAARTSTQFGGQPSR